jgi:peptide/nickel transport system substrate-binding protein
LLRLLALLLSLALVAAACSSDDDTEATGSDTSTDQDDGSDGDDGDDGETDGDTGSDDGSDTGSEDDGLTLTVALETDYAPTTYNPQRVANTQFPFHSLLYDSLFVTSSEGEIVPNIVTEFATNEEATELVFSLREDIVFDDGTPLDAELVKANLDRRLTEEMQAYTIFGEGQEGEIADVVASGPYEVTISWAFEDGLANGHELLIDTVGAIVGPKGAADITSLEAAPEGSGPYTLDLDASTRGASYVMRKRADHWNADAYAYDTVVFNVIADAQARANAVVSGEADVAVRIEPNQLSLVEAEAGLAKIGGTVASWPILDKTGERVPAFEFVETRHALSLAIDRQAIVDALRPGARPTVQFFPQQAEGFDPTLEERYAYDPERARELLASVGLEDGFEFEKAVLGDPTDVELAIQQMWQQELGVTVNFPAVANTGELFASVNSNAAIYNEWGLGLRPAGFVAGPVTSGFLNTQGAENEAISAALGPALGGDPDSLVALGNALVDEGWWIGVFEDFFYAGYNPDSVQGVPFAGIAGYIVVADIEPAG